MAYIMVMLRWVFYVLLMSSVAWSKDDGLQVLRNLNSWTPHPVFVSKSHSDTPQFKAFKKMYENPRYNTLIKLLPTQFDVKSSTNRKDIQNLIDSLYQEIFSSTRGQWICKATTGGQVNRLQQIFGISKDLADKIKKDCTPESDFKDYIKFEFPREYFFVITPEEPVVSGWTNSFGVTVFIMKPNEITREHVLRLMIHEMAMRIDQKQPNGSVGMLLFGRNFIEYEGQNKCLFVSRLYDLSTQYIFAAIRAEKLEDEILSELGYAVKPEAPEKFCGEKAITRAESVVQLKSIYEADERIHQEIGLCSNFKKADHETGDLVDSILALDKEFIRIKDQVTTACKFLSEPEWGNFIFSALAGGPRPRIGNGWGQSSGTTKDIGKDLNSQKVTEIKMNLKAINASKVTFPGFQLEDNNEVKKNRFLKKSEEQ